MRVVFVNLHENVFFVKTLEMMIWRRRAVTKHSFLLTWLFSHNVEVVDYITPSCSKLPTALLRRLTRNAFAQKRIAKFVFKKNNFPVKKIKIITDCSEIREDDVVIYYGTFVDSQFETINDVRGIKIVDHVHFFGDKKKAELLRDKGISYYMYEVNLQKYSLLFQKNYNWFHGKYIERPYAFEERFVNKTSFRSRKNKAVAIGTLTRCAFPELEEAYKTKYYQPHRKMIMDHALEMSDYIDSFISEYQETAFKNISKDDFVVMRILKKFYNASVAGKQKSYFSFNMVDKYNEYKMFICPEDVNGSYGVGTIEGMACGCAMIGVNYGIFEDMGMVDGKHYISYDGSIEDLKDKIQYYQEEEHQGQLEQIAKTGCEFIRSNYSQNMVAEKYYSKLKLIVEGKI